MALQKRNKMNPVEAWVEAAAWHVGVGALGENQSQPPFTLGFKFCPAYAGLFTKVKRDEARKMPSAHLRQVVLRSVAWGFSSSGVERTFSRGGWIKGRREVTVDLASDELWATHFDGDQDQFLGMKKQSNQSQLFLWSKAYFFPSPGF